MSDSVTWESRIAVRGSLLDEIEKNLPWRARFCEKRRIEKGRDGIMESWHQGSGRGRNEQ